MPLVQNYYDYRQARLFDGDLIVDLSYTGFRYNTGFSENAITRILGRMGYVRSGNWKYADWGSEAVFKRRVNQSLNQTKAG